MPGFSVKNIDFIIPPPVVNAIAIAIDIAIAIAIAIDIAIAIMEAVPALPFPAMPLALHHRLLSAVAEAHFRRQPPPRGPPVAGADACSPEARRRVLDAVGLNRSMAVVARRFRVQVEDQVEDKVKDQVEDKGQCGSRLLALLRTGVFENNGDEREMRRYLTAFDRYVKRGPNAEPAGSNTVLFNRLSSFQELVSAWKKMPAPYKSYLIGFMESTLFFVDGYELEMKIWGRSFPTAFSRLGAFELAFIPDPYTDALEIEGVVHRPDPARYLTASQSAALRYSVRYEYDRVLDRLVYTPFRLPEPTADEQEVLEYRNARLASDTADVDERLRGSRYPPLRELQYDEFAMWRAGTLLMDDENFDYDYDYNA
jgi:hypothetical protein